MNVVTQVIKCDITSQSAVLAAVHQASTPIKGVIQAAMVVNDAVSDTMSLTQFRSVVDPKVMGTVNLHTATLDQLLDFFTMTSSIMTMIGTATQGSYCAGNAFQDSFARYRGSLGLPAQSFALGMILELGFVSQLPEVQKSLMRNGVYGSGEVEFLKLLEGSFASQLKEARAENAESDTRTAAADPLATSHLLTGLEPAKLLGFSRKGPATAFTWHTDARFGRLLQALEDLAHQQVQPGGGAGGNSSASSAIAAALANSSMDLIELKDLLTSAILERLSKLLFTPVDEMDPLKAVSTYGMDSMIAAELRNWFVKVLKTDIAFLELLDPSTKIVDLVEKVVRGLEKEK